MKFLAVAIALASAAAVNAQSNATLQCLTTTQLTARIPACARQCETAALSADGCAFEDLTCHCLNTNVVATLIEPCLLTTSNCTEAEVGTFAGIVTTVCEVKNATAFGQLAPVDCSRVAPPPTNCSSHSCNETTPTSSTPPIATFTGAAANLVGSGILAAVGLIGAGLLL
ncbi:hypothetical protein W97_00857 [Coniosporium apollinis CBS 100218]|uniref:CFEM domain-containing protein n=1 Tax=Coniosporium apollinis (strain CBS 100218) TaxID=1168221 RepID=R7YJ54_CONA1|nr:uncharacterized protein W97_00857 [Coniosporium apollinis CBS 100218]EON61641.1 hypothetical protein W97_00857 [Coniosporium apollinis CBS 100218]